VLSSFTGIVVGGMIIGQAISVTIASSAKIEATIIVACISSVIAASITCFYIKVSKFDE